jgi:hypothetical protein
MSGSRPGAGLFQRISRVRQSLANRPFGGLGTMLDGLPGGTCSMLHGLAGFLSSLLYGGASFLNWTLILRPHR